MRFANARLIFAAVAGEVLRVIDGAEGGTRIPIDSELEVGRAAKGPGNLCGDDELSRHHARITYGPEGEVVIFDLGSTNGTFVNGQRLATPAILRPGDKVRMGRTTLELTSNGSNGAAAQTQLILPRAPAATAPPTARQPPAPPAPQAAASAPPAAVPQPPATEPIRTPAPIGRPSVIRAGLPATMKGRIFPSVGALIVQIIVGYEWLLSGLTKLFRGGFPSGLASNLRDSSADADAWYQSFLHSVIIPNAKLFGVIIMLSELAVGVVLIGAALLWMFRWETMRRPTRDVLLLGTVAACIGGIFMNVNFFLTNGDPPPFFIAKDAFDEGVGLDALLPMLEVVLGGVALWTYLSLRRSRKNPAPG